MARQGNVLLRGMLDRAMQSSHRSLQSTPVLPLGSSQMFPDQYNLLQQEGTEVISQRDVLLEPKLTQIGYHGSSPPVGEGVGGPNRHESSISAEREEAHIKETPKKVCT